MIRNIVVELDSGNFVIRPLLCQVLFFLQIEDMMILKIHKYQQGNFSQTRLYGYFVNPSSRIASLMDDEYEYCLLNEMKPYNVISLDFGNPDDEYIPANDQVNQNDVFHSFSFPLIGIIGTKNLLTLNYPTYFPLTDVKGGYALSPIEEYIGKKCWFTMKTNLFFFYNTPVGSH
ncbi:hypothetical protein WA158_006942 [Blastocystis sp. Blastoise]